MQGLFECEVTVYVKDVEDLNNLCMNISKIKEINSVERIETEMRKEKN